MTMRETVARVLCEAVAMWLQTPSDRRQRTDVEADAAIAALWPLAMEAAAKEVQLFLMVHTPIDDVSIARFVEIIRNLEPHQ